MVLRIKEPVNGLSHLLGAILSIAGLAVLVTLAVREASTWHVVSFSIYGTSMILLYTASALYHMLPLSEKGTRIFRAIDHIMIFMLIAGTYTPFCLVAIRGGWGWSILGAAWGLAVVGAIFTLIWMDAPRWLSTAFYMAMGWMCVVAIYPIVKAVPTGGLLWLAAGGLSYSIGAVIYGIKKPDPWPGVFGFHEIFHIFVLGGSFCHFFMMFSYILEMP